MKYGKIFAAVTVVFFCAFHPCFAAEEKSKADEIMERRQKAELKTFYLADPKASKVPETPISIQLFNQAVEFFQHQEYDLARDALNDALKYDKANGFAYELLGDIDNMQEKLADAKKNYEIAYNLNPRESTKEKIEKLNGERKASKNLATYNEQHFIIKYNKKSDQDKGFELRELLRTTYARISKDFGYYFNHQVVVILYDPAEFKKIEGLPHWAAGMYDGKVRMPMNPGGFADLDVRALTTHEVTHAFVAGMSGNRAPAWINEGLAQHEENKIKPVEMIVFESAIKTSALMPLIELMQPDATQKLNDPLLVSLFYQESLHLVNYLVARYGMFLVKQMLADYGKGKDSEEVVRERLRISSERLEKEWKASFLKTS